MTRPLDWTPLGLAVDPTPGDPAAVVLGGRAYQRVALAIGETAASVGRLDPEGMVSRAVDALMEKKQEAVEEIRRAQDRYQVTGDAMVGYGQALEGVQRETLDALLEAQRAQAEQAAAERQAMQFQDQVRDAKQDDEKDELRRQVDQAEGAIAVAAGAIAAARARVEEAVATRDAAAERAMSLIQEITSRDGLNDSWWQDLSGGAAALIATVVGAVDDAWDDSIGWVGARGAELEEWAGNGLVALGGWFGDAGRSVSDWFGDRVDEIGAGVGQGVDWVEETSVDLGTWFGDTAADVGDWGVETSEDLGDWFTDRGQDIEHFNQTLLNAWPRLAQVGARSIMAHGSFLSGGLLFQEGEAYAEDPVPIAERIFSDKPGDHDVPYGLEDLTGQVTNTYANPGEIRVTTVESPQGSRVIVSVPGTEEWSPLAGDNPMDLTGDLATVAGWDESTMASAVRLAMENAEIPEGAEVMMVGHSLGGMTVGALAEDPAFVEQHNVTKAVTFGSPIDSDRIGSGVDVLEMQHEADVVPRLDLEDLLAVPVPLGVLPVPSGHVQEDAHHATVTFENPGEWWDAATNHSHEKYTDSVRANMDDPRLAGYERELRESGFLVDQTPGQRPDVTAETIRLGRTFDDPSEDEQR